MEAGEGGKRQLLIWISRRKSASCLGTRDSPKWAVICRPSHQPPPNLLTIQMAESPQGAAHYIKLPFPSQICST